jgi:hypothetical protein
MIHMLLTRNARGIAETFERHDEWRPWQNFARLILTRQQHLCYFLLSSTA